MQLYLDCDGVRADFDRGATELLGMPPRVFEKRRGIGIFWRELARHPDFYGSLPLMPDAMRLFEAIRHLEPIILTGLPRGQWAAPQKVRWAAEHFPGTRILPVVAVDKRNHELEGDILIDDQLRHAHLWKEGGGIFFHHVDAETTIAKLAALAGDFVVSGVANTSLASAQKAAEASGLPYAFENADALVSSPKIDLVVVTVKVPYHHELVMKALDAGKHVYCEWPLGNGLAEAREMADLAEAKGVVAAVGTQMRVAPEVEYLRQLIADGYVGEVLSTTLVGSGGSWGAETDADHAYVYDNANGASLLTIPVGHALAGLREVLGDFRGLSGKLINRRRIVRVTDTGETRPFTAHDQVLAQGTLASGAAVSVHYRGGVSRGTNFLWEINGTGGDIQVAGDSGHAQIVQLSIFGARGDVKQLEPLSPPASAYEGWPNTSVARNVARIYALIARDIRSGTRTAPSFRDAVALHETIDAIETSAAGGEVR